MAYKEGVAEILERVSKIKSRKEQVAVLRRDHNIALETIVDLCFNENLKFKLPDTDPPYTPQPKEADMQAQLYNKSNLRKFAMFLKGVPQYRKLPNPKREQIYIQLLEMVDPDDAKLLLAIKNKNMPYRGITAKLFEEAWPALASTWKKKEQ
tara:strand:+ start:642 stop:1097 length:456 start_codon:yes stop_codon:yes gene_type:complete